MNEQLLAQLEEMSSLMLAKKDIATILEIDQEDFNDFLSDKLADPWKRFQSGRMKTIAQVRKSIFELASNGSSPAQMEAMRLIRDAQMDDL
jgi:hypothetical protein